MASLSLVTLSISSLCAFANACLEASLAMSMALPHLWQPEAQTFLVKSKDESKLNRKLTAKDMVKEKGLSSLRKTIPHRLCEQPAPCAINTCCLSIRALLRPLGWSRSRSLPSPILPLPLAIFFTIISRHLLPNKCTACLLMYF